MFVYSTANYFDSLYIYLKAYTHSNCFPKNNTYENIYD